MLSLCYELHCIKHDWCYSREIRIFKSNWNHWKTKKGSSCHLDAIIGSINDFDIDENREIVQYYDDDDVIIPKAPLKVRGIPIDLLPHNAVIAKNNDIMFKIDGLDEIDDVEEH